MNQQRIVIDYTCGVGLFRKFAYITSVGKPIFLCVLWAVYISAVSLSRAFKKKILGLLLHPVGALFSNMLGFFCVFFFTVLRFAARIPGQIGHSQDALRIHITAKRASSELAAHGSCYATHREMANSDYVPVMT